MRVTIFLLIIGIATCVNQYTKKLERERAARRRIIEAALAVPQRTVSTLGGEIRARRIEGGRGYAVDTSSLGLLRKVLDDARRQLEALRLPDDPS